MTDSFHIVPEAASARQARDAIALECEARALRARVLAGLLRQALSAVWRRAAALRGAVPGASTPASTPAGRAA